MVNLVGSIEYGNYISLVKFVPFLVLFMAWLPLVGWVYDDARMLKLRYRLWSGILLGAGAVTILLWLFVPFFVIGLLFFLIAVCATSGSYVMHRNARVADFERVLTVDSFKGLFHNEAKKMAAAAKQLIFITANRNEVPVPQPKTAEFFGYKIARELFDDIITRRVSDIRFVPTAKDYVMGYTIDGMMFKQPSLPRAQADFLLRFVKHLADMDVSEKRKPQKGTFSILMGKETIDWEMATAGSTAGEQMQIKRVIEGGAMKIDTIGLTEKQVEQISGVRETRNGVFIVAGPAKSGVSTSFYSLLRSHDPYMSNIYTLEREPMGNLDNVTQNVFSLSDTGTSSYSEKLRTLLQQEPDILGVADCEDTKTANYICNAAERGKLVYVVLEANNVLQAIEKWIKLVGDQKRAIEVLTGVSNQRLLRKLCLECRQAYEPNKELLRKFNIPADEVKLFYRPGEAKYDKRGKGTPCENCQATGFRGITGVFETAVFDEDLKAAIKDVEGTSEIGKQLRRAKMLYLQEQALKKVTSGETAINEVIRIFTPKKKASKKKTMPKK